MENKLALEMAVMKWLGFEQASNDYMKQLWVSFISLALRIHVRVSYHTRLCGVLLITDRKFRVGFTKPVSNAGIRNIILDMYYASQALGGHSDGSIWLLLQSFVSR